MAAILAIVASLCGCTSLTDYVHNGFKVGPNYCKPAAPVAKTWIDANDARVKPDEVDLSRWWTVFNDPALNSLVCTAYHQNLTLREAGFRVLEARSQLGIDTGEFFPQTQQMTGSYTRNAQSRNTANSSFIGKRFFSQSNFGFNLAWELDFWGRFRRAIESDEATLDAQRRTLRLRVGHVAWRHRHQLRPDAHTRAADQIRPRQRAGATRHVDDRRSSLQSQHDQRTGRRSGPQHAGRHRGRHSRIRNQPPANDQSALHLNGHAARRTAFAARAGKHSARRHRKWCWGCRRICCVAGPTFALPSEHSPLKSAQIGVAEAEFYPQFRSLGNLGWSAQRASHLFIPARSTAVSARRFSGTSSTMAGS